MVDHFSVVSGVYNRVRTTDTEPVRFIKKHLFGRAAIAGADIGVGGGRYSHLLLREIAGLHLTCVDYNLSMLDQAGQYMRGMGTNEFHRVRADSDELPFRRNSFDCVLAFNAVHHFELELFIREAIRILKHDGLLFIYTRLRNQNERTIWGRYFPDFASIESRLYDRRRLENGIRNVRSLVLEATKFFSYRRAADLDQLVTKAKSRHYSTFSLYEPDHFKRALHQFKENIKRTFPDENEVTWTDENVMVVARAFKPQRKTVAPGIGFAERATELSGLTYRTRRS